MELNETIKVIVDNLATGENLDSTRELVVGAIGEKVLGALEARKQEIAASYFGQAKVDSE